MNSDSPPPETEDPDRTNRIRTQMKMLISKLVEDLCTDLEESKKYQSKLQGEVAKVSLQVESLKSENQELTSRLQSQETVHHRLTEDVKELKDEVEYLQHLVASNDNGEPKGYVHKKIKKKLRPNRVTEGTNGAAVVSGGTNGKLSHTRNKTEVSNGPSPTIAQKIETPTTPPGQGANSSQQRPIFCVKKFRIPISPRNNQAPATGTVEHNKPVTSPDISDGDNDNIQQQSAVGRTTMNSLATAPSTSRPTIIAHGSLAATVNLDLKVSSLVHQQQQLTTLLTNVVKQQSPSTPPPPLVQSSTSVTSITSTKKVKKKRRPVRGYAFSLEKPRKKKLKKQEPEEPDQKLENHAQEPESDQHHQLQQEQLKSSAHSFSVHSRVL